MLPMLTPIYTNPKSRTSFIDQIFKQFLFQWCPERIISLYFVASFRIYVQPDQWKAKDPILQKIIGVIKRRVIGTKSLKE